MKKQTTLALLLMVIPVLAAIPSGYVSYWKMDSGFTDENGTNPGTFTGGPEAFASGVNGQAVSLSGTTYVDLGTDASLDFSGNFSIGGWVYLTAGAGYQKIVDKSTWNTGFFIQQGGSWPGYWDFYFRGGNHVMETESIADQYNSWVHFMGIYDGSVMYLYRNGTLVDTASSGSMTPSSASLKFGSIRAYLDEMVYYNRALNGTEVSDLMAATRDTTPPVITDIAADTLPVFTAVITWKTDMIATSEVEYGIDTSYFSRLYPDLDTLHNVQICGLTDGTEYYYRVRSKNSQGYESVSPWCTLAVSPPHPLQKMNLPATGTPRITVPPDRVWPAVHGDAQVCLWADDKLCALNLSVDDNGMFEQTWWINMTQKYDFQVTWFVVPGGFDGGGHGFFGTWDTWKVALDSGQDMQSHSYYHGCNDCVGDYYYGTDFEYAEAVNSIKRTWGYRPLTIAYPGQSAFTHYPHLAAKYYLSARGTQGGLNPTATTNYLMTKVTNLDTSTILSAINSRAFMCNYYHGVASSQLPIEEQDSIRALKEERFAWIYNNHRQDIWWDGYTRITQYAQSRDTHTLTVSSVTESLIRFTLTDSMMDTLFTYPLTVKVRIDNTWDTCYATQNGNTVQASVVEYQNNKYALVKAVPDRGEVVLSNNGQVTGIVMRSAEYGMRYIHLKRMFRMNGQEAYPGRQQEPGMYLLYDGKTVTKLIILK